MSDAMVRAIVCYGLDENYNRGLEDAARFLDADYTKRPPSVFARHIRAMKRNSQSHLAEAKVESGKISGLLSSPSGARSA